MRVLYFSATNGPHDQRFLDALAKSAHEVWFARLGRGSSDVPEGIREACWSGASQQFSWWGVPSLVRDFRALVHTVSPDLIHAGPIQTCALIAILSGFRPILGMSWGFDLMQDADRNAWWRWVTRYVLRRTTHFTSDAEVTRARAIKFGADPGRITVFPWGVDLGMFRPSSSTRANAHAEIRILCNRTWDPRYGVDVLARAFPKAVAVAGSLRLRLLADGTQSKLIRTLLADAESSGLVYYGGRLPAQKLVKEYQSSDIYVSPSHVDGSSVSLMEAMACGLCVLVSDIPANREWVKHGVNGRLFRDGDVDDLVSQLLVLAKAPAERERLGREALATAQTRADWSRNFNELLRAYDLTLAEAASSAGGGQQ